MCARLAARTYSEPRSCAPGGLSVSISPTPAVASVTYETCPAKPLRRSETSFYVELGAGGVGSLNGADAPPPAPNLDFAKSNFNKKRHSLLSIDGLLVPTLPTRPRTSWRRGNCKSPALRSMRSALFFHLDVARCCGWHRVAELSSASVDEPAMAGWLCQWPVVVMEAARRSLVFGRRGHRSTQKSTALRLMWSARFNLAGPLLAAHG